MEPSEHLEEERLLQLAKGEIKIDCVIAQHLILCDGCRQILQTLTLKQRRTKEAAA